MKFFGVMNGLLLAACIVTVEAQNHPFYQSARLIPKSATRATFSGAGLYDDGAFRPGGALVYGSHITFGAGDRVNLIVQNNPKTEFFSDDRISFNYLGLITKLGLFHDRLALCLPAGIVISEYFSFQGEMLLLWSLNPRSRAVVTLAPTVSLLAGIHSAVGMGCGLNVEIPVGKRGTTIIPEVGVSIWPLSEWEEEWAGEVYAGVAWSIRAW